MFKSSPSDKGKLSQSPKLDRYEDKPEFERIRHNETLGLQAIPYFGIYGKGV
jgi:hypothetical protein